MLLLIAIVCAIGFYGYLTCLKNSETGSNKNQKFLKPEMTAFVLYRFIRSFILSAIIFGVLFSGYKLFIDFLIHSNVFEAESFDLSIHYFWWFSSVMAIFIYVSLSIQYKKEKYFFNDDNLIHKGGGIFSEFEKELSVKNITHVTMRLPFIENKLCDTGYIKIESAGALTSEIFLRSVVNSKELYNNVIEIMKKNDFKLSRKKLVEQERPHPLAVFFEVFGLFAGVIGFIALILFDAVDEFKLDIGKLIIEYSSLLFGVGGIVIAGILTFCFFRFLDLNKRIYDLYEDVIEYSEGFFNKNYSFIPIENLTDSAITQSIPSRIFGLYDVKISCQGSGQEILFKNIKNGEQLSNNIDQLISKSKSLIKKEEVARPIINNDTSEPKSSMREVEPDRKYKDEFKMDKLRTWIPAIILSPLLIIIFPAGILVAINNLITVACNTFKIKADTVEHTFSFFSKKIKEFSLSKVTGIVIKENFMDKWCKTCSILFWSIGSGESISFLNIKKTNSLREKILAKKGIRKQNVLYSLDSSYTILSMIKGNLYTYLTYTLLILLCFIFLPSYWILSSEILVVCLIIVFIYKKIYYKKSKIIFYEDFVHFTKGLFFVSEYFVYYDDIKDISTIKLPLSNKGHVKFNVAGEQVIPSGKSTRTVSNSFTICFVDGISTLDELLDTIFYQRPSVEKMDEIKKRIEDTSEEPEYRTKPSLLNYLLFLVPGVIIIDIAIFITIPEMNLIVTTAWLIKVLLLFSTITIGCFVAIIKAISYNIHDYRVYKRSGIIYKKQISIVFEKIDFINISQGAINKMFGNGNVTINTVGSSNPELTINNIKDFKKFYEIVKNRYK